MGKKPEFPDKALLPTVNQPGTYEWCEEVVECMNAAWRTKETSEQAFLAAVRAAAEHRIWETLSPPAPAEPYVSLEGLIRQTADPGEAEYMQIAIRVSGVLGEPEETAPPWGGTDTGFSSVSMLSPDGGTGAELDPDDEVALGNALLDQYASQVSSLGFDPSAVANAIAVARQAAAVVGLPTPASPRPTAAQRKRERLERTYPELAEAVLAGEMTLKQAYIQAGIEKEVPALDKLQRLWRKASEAERQRFLSWADEQLQRERLREYQQDVYGDDA